MPDIGLSPLVVPYGADQTIYLVVDCVGGLSTCRETELERPDVDSVIADMLAGKFSEPVRVLAFNTLEHWSRDISNDVAAQIRVLCDIEGTAVPDYVSDFIEHHTAQARLLPH